VIPYIYLYMAFYLFAAARIKYIFLISDKILVTVSIKIEI